MAKKRNELTKHIKELHRKLALINFSAFTAHCSFERDIKRTETFIEKGQIDKLITAAALVGIDVLETDSTKVSGVSYGGRMVRKSDTIKAINEMNGIVQSDAIANAFEAFEKYIVEITPIFLFDRRGMIPIQNKVKQQTARQFGKQTAAENTPPYFSQITAYLARRNCDDIFKILFKKIDGLEVRAANHHKYRSLIDIHSAVEQVRHCKTHSNGKYNADSYSKKSQQTKEIIASLVKDSVIHGEKRILPDYDQTKDLLAREAEYAQIIYVKMSEELSMKLDYLS